MDRCQRCNSEEQDLRTLWMACFYEMDELGLPFSHTAVDGRRFYTLRVCKDCRADWMKEQQEWFVRTKTQENTGSGCFVREYGTNKEL
jgi:hypothetical protein